MILRPLYHEPETCLAFPHGSLCLVPLADPLLQLLRSHSECHANLINLGHGRADVVHRPASADCFRRVAQLKNSEIDASARQQGNPGCKDDQAGS